MKAAVADSKFNYINKILNSDVISKKFWIDEISKFVNLSEMYYVKVPDESENRFLLPNSVEFQFFVIFW